MISLLNIQRVDSPEDVLSFRVPWHYREAVSQQLARLERSLNTERRYSVTVKRYRRRMSTGPGSQNNHIHGHASQIADYTGHYLEEIKLVGKLRAVARGYPTEQVAGQRVPLSLADPRVTTEYAALVIEELHVMAAEMEIELLEGDDGTMGTT